MKSKTGIIMMILGAMMVAAALSLAAYNYHEDKVAGETAVSILDELEKAISDNAKQQAAEGTVTIPGQKVQQAYEATDHVIVNKDSLVSVSEDEESKKPRSIYVSYHYYVGIISIPELGIRLPVLDSYEGDNLTYSPCLYSGYADGQMIICAHNYNSHFGRIKELSAGSRVIFTDIFGNEYEYTVEDIEIVPGSDSNKMESGEWDLSLFTCTFDGSDRVTVRCSREDAD